MKTSTSLLRFLTAAGMLGLAACATVPPPSDALQAADIAIANAEKEHAADYAPLEMRRAHEKITEAHTAPAEGTDQSVMHARRLANEARADADLAFAKARLAKAVAVNQDLQKNNNTLRQEIQRGSGG